VPGQEPTVAYLGNVYLVARLSVDNSNMQCFHNTTYTYIYVLRTTSSSSYIYGVPNADSYVVQRRMGKEEGLPIWA
jgi:hypothetical protein